MPGYPLPWSWRRRYCGAASGFTALTTAPLLLTAGAWTLTGSPDSILAAPIPAGLPAAGLRASLMEIYWPSVFSLLPNISKLSFTLPYALAFVVLARAAHAAPRSWLSVMTLAGLVGFVGLLATSLAPMLFVLWAGMEAIYLVAIQARRFHASERRDPVGIGRCAGRASAYRRELLSHYALYAVARTVIGVERTPGWLAPARHARPASGRSRPPWPWPYSRSPPPRRCWPGGTAWCWRWRREQACYCLARCR